MRPLGLELLFNIWSDVERLVHDAYVYRTLYGTDLGKEVVNRIAPHTFQVILQALRTTLVVGVTRLLIDPPTDKRGNRENLSLKRLVLPKDTLGDNGDRLTTQLEAIQDKYSDIKLVRDKIFAHRDAETVQEMVNRFRRQLENRNPPQDDTIKQYSFLDCTDIDVLDAVDEIRDFFSACWRANFPRGDPFVPRDITDVTELLDALSASKEKR